MANKTPSVTPHLGQLQAAEGLFLLEQVAERGTHADEGRHGRKALDDAGMADGFGLAMAAPLWDKGQEQDVDEDSGLAGGLWVQVASSVGAGTRFKRFSYEIRGRKLCFGGGRKANYGHFQNIHYELTNG